MFYKFQSFQAPKGYVFKDPDTGREFKADSKKELMDRIIAYRKQNNLEEIEHLSFILESYWCGLPENRHKCVPTELTRGTWGYIKGGIALAKTLLYKKIVPSEVADERSEQCSRCKYNVFPDKGAFITWSDKIAEASTDGRRSRRHDELGNCEVCSCPLKAKVWFGGNIEIEKEWVGPFEEVNCWQLKVRKP